MQTKKFNQKLLAEILVNAIYTGFCDYSKYIETYKQNTNEIARLTRQDIIQLANQLLSKEILNKYPEFEITKPDLFSKLDNATNEAKVSLEAKREILQQICLDIMEKFPILQAIKIESVEYGIIKVTTSDETVQNSTLIAINDEEQLKQNIQEFLDKVETKKGQSK